MWAARARVDAVAFFDHIPEFSFSLVGTSQQSTRRGLLPCSSQVHTHGVEVGVEVADVYPHCARIDLAGANLELKKLAIGK